MHLICLTPCGFLSTAMRVRLSPRATRTVYADLERLPIMSACGRVDAHVGCFVGLAVLFPRTRHDCHIHVIASTKTSQAQLIHRTPSTKMEGPLAIRYRNYLICNLYDLLPRMSWLTCMASSGLGCTNFYGVPARHEVLSSLIAPPVLFTCCCVKFYTKSNLGNFNQIYRKI